MNNISILSCLYIFIGGGIGAVTRYLVGLHVAKSWGNDFPYGTLLINITGSFIMGMIASYFMFSGNSDNQNIKLFLMVGILGGFTTFSSFSLEVLTLLQKDQALMALGYILLSVLISLAVVYLGFELVKLKFR